MMVQQEGYTHRIKTISYNWIIVFCLVYGSLAIKLDTPNQIFLWVIIPLLFVYCMSVYRAILLKNKYIGIYIVILLWSLATCLIASDMFLALMQLRIMLSTFVLSIIFYSLSQNKRYLPWLYLTFLLIVLANYYYVRNNILTDMVIGLERANDEKFNANELSYFLFYAICAVFVFGEIFTDDKRKLSRIFLFAFIAIIPYFALITMSRQIFVIVIPFCLFSIIYRYNPFSSIKRLVVYGVLLAIFIFIIYYYYLPLYEASIFVDRLSRDVTEDSRFALIVGGFLLGFQNPLLGVGPGNVLLYLNGSFTHSSYAELFAASGLFPLVLFISLIAKFILEQWRRYRQTNDKLFMYFFMTGIFWAAYNWFYVFYSSFWLMCFLFLLIGHSNQRYKESKVKGV
mgnify:CR=1 FL=1